MALSKSIELENGVIVNYHRIVSINKITNSASIIEIASYSSREKREEEIRKLQNNEEMNIYINTIYIEVEYDESKKISDYYQYLKTTQLFKNAKDDVRALLESED